MRDQMAGFPGSNNPNRNDPFAGTDGVGRSTPLEDRAAWLAGTEMEDQLRDVWDLANKNNVAIYAVDPRGLATNEFGIDQNINNSTDSTYLRNTMDTLRTLAVQTDGRAILNRNDIALGMSSSPAAEWEEPAEAHAGEVRKLSTLLEASQALSATLDLKESLQRVLEILGRHHGAVRSTVVLLNENSGDVELEAASGAITAKRVRYRVGEGITGKVVQTGKPMVVPRVSREPMFLSRAAERPELPGQELTYISAPIALDSKTVGAIGIDLHFKAERDYNRTVKFLGVVGSMIAQAVRVHRLIQADKQRLVDENTHLRQELKERYDFSNLVGTSGPMHQVYEQIAQVARTNTTVLLRGESGTGKELIANVLKRRRKLRGLLRPVTFPCGIVGKH